MYDLTIIKKNGGAYIDSREVATLIGKDHRHLLRDIRGYAKVIENSNAPNFGLVDFFIESSYIDSKGETRPCFLISKIGCEMVSNKLIGEKGILFTALYVAKFNAMEAAELEARAETPPLKVFNTAVRNVLNGFSYARSSPERVMNFLRGAYKPFGIEVIKQGERNEHTLSASNIAVLYDIYSESGRPHSHAVGAIIEKLNLAPEHIAVVPYGMVGVAVRYDFFVYNAVGEWLAKNNYPQDIPHLDFEYHIFYQRQLSLDDYGLGGYEFEDDEDLLLDVEN